MAALLAKAGCGRGRGFLDQDPAAWRKVVDTNITGTLLLLQKVARDVRGSGEGRILITGSIAGFMPGTYQAVYNGSKTFLDSFSLALRHELMGQWRQRHVPDAGCHRDGFLRDGRLDGHQGRHGEEGRPGDGGGESFSAMMKGEGDVVTGWHNKLQSAIANILPAGATAELHRKMSAAGTAS